MIWPEKFKSFQSAYNFVRLRDDRVLYSTSSWSGLEQDAIDPNHDGLAEIASRSALAQQHVDILPAILEAITIDNNQAVSHSPGISAIGLGYHQAHSFQPAQYAPVGLQRMTTNLGDGKGEGSRCWSCSSTVGALELIADWAIGQEVLTASPGVPRLPGVSLQSTVTLDSTLIFALSDVAVEGIVPPYDHAKELHHRHESALSHRTFLFDPRKVSHHVTTFQGEDEPGEVTILPAFSVSQAFTSRAIVTTGRVFADLRWTADYTSRCVPFTDGFCNLDAGTPSSQMDQKLVPNMTVNSVAKCLQRAADYPWPPLSEGTSDRPQDVPELASEKPLRLDDFIAGTTFWKMAKNVGGPPADEPVPNVFQKFSAEADTSSTASAQPGPSATISSYDEVHD